MRDGSRSCEAKAKETRRAACLFRRQKPQGTARKVTSCSPRVLLPIASQTPRRSEGEASDGGENRAASKAFSE